MDLVWIYYAWDGVATQVKGMETNYISFADLDEALDYYSPVIIANNVRAFSLTRFIRGRL